jgi:hypothetical protein
MTMDAISATLIVFWNSGSLLGCNWHHCAVAEALTQHGMIPTSPSNIWKVLDKLHMLWMGIWSHLEAMSTTCICQNLGSLLKSFTAGQQTTPLSSVRGSNPTSWNGSNIPSQHMLKGSWQASYAVDGHMVPYSAHYCYRHLSCPRFGKASEIMVHCWAANDTIVQWLRF